MKRQYLLLVLLIEISESGKDNSEQPLQDAVTLRTPRQIFLASCIVSTT